MYVSAWTSIMLTSYDAYQFLDYFLTPILHDFGFIPEEPLAYFSQIQMNWMCNECPPCDQFLGSDFYFVRVYGFSEEPFRLPTYIIERTLALKFFWQLPEVERAIVIGKHDTSITEDHKAIGPITLIQKSIVENVLTSKLVQLSLVSIDDVWSYDPNECMSKRKNAVKHEPQSLWEGRTNPPVNDPNLYVGPSDFTILKRPSWLNFYPILQKNNLAKPIPQSMLEVMRNDLWPKEKEDFQIYHQEVNQPRANIGNAPFDERFEAKW